MNKRWMEWDVLCGASAAVLAGASLAIVDIQTPLRRTLQQPLYELGMGDLVGTFNATLVNGAGHILAGALLGVAAIAQLRSGDRNNVAQAAALLLAGIFWVALGITPARYGDEAAMVIHGFWMIGFQFTASATLLLMAWDEWMEHWSRGLLFMVGALMVLGSVLSGLRGLPVPGLLERVGIGAFFICVGLQAYRWWQAVAIMPPHTALR